MSVTFVHCLKTVEEADLNNIVIIVIGAHDNQKYFLVWKSSKFVKIFSFVKRHMHIYSMSFTFVQSFKLFV